MKKFWGGACVSPFFSGHGGHAQAPPATQEDAPIAMARSKQVLGAAEQADNILLKPAGR